MDIVYIDDIIPNFSGLAADFSAVLNDLMLAPTVRQLQALGKVHVGMFGSWEFTEL